MNIPNGSSEVGGNTARGRFLSQLARALVSPDSYGLVLLLILVTYLVSVSTPAAWAASVVLAVQIGTVWVALRVSQAGNRARRAADIVLGLAVVAGVANLFVGEEDWGVAVVSFMAGLLYLVAPLVIARHLLFRHQIDRQTVLGALDIYLLIGMLFAFVYRLLAVLQTSPFFGANGDAKFPQDLFFSFTTLTTTGYGNLVPQNNPGQSLAVLEMLVGQLFLVTVVSKVVNVYRPASPSRAESTEH